MAGRPQSHRWRSATGPQLWRLNMLGRLKVVDEAVCISSAEASAELDLEIAKLGEPYFPDTKVTTRLAAERTSEGESRPSRPLARALHASRNASR
jgi:hypothetical protein